uniref:BRK domain-containing protein n=1 Tax=Timspurckia oligopyrenoides TaxID=708627 RepID=A0A7S0ZL13_9RHOD|mmetsp:Transcript_9372/g.16900  ORF Transcript_9372/g.16900 Transcript_9372/m.16900 type:complete len:455 (+) Transcript_9372:352-1716(+)
MNESGNHGNGVPLVMSSHMMNSASSNGSGMGSVPGHSNPEDRVAIWNRSTGRKIAGSAAPFAKNIANYLTKHPECEIYSGQDKIPVYRKARPILPQVGIQPQQLQHHEHQIQVSLDNMNGLDHSQAAALHAQQQVFMQQQQQQQNNAMAMYLQQQQQHQQQQQAQFGYEPFGGVHPQFVQQNPSQVMNQQQLQNGFGSTASSSSTQFLANGNGNSSSLLQDVQQYPLVATESPSHNNHKSNHVNRNLLPSAHPQQPNPQLMQIHGNVPLGTSNSDGNNDMSSNIYGSQPIHIPMNTGSTGGAPVSGGNVNSSNRFPSFSELLQHAGTGFDIRSRDTTMDFKDMNSYLSKSRDMSTDFGNLPVSFSNESLRGTNVFGSWAERTGSAFPRDQSFEFLLQSGQQQSMHSQNGNDSSVLPPILSSQPGQSFSRSLRCRNCGRLSSSLTTIDPCTCKQP